jgi:hypothetical protein
MTTLPGGIRRLVGYGLDNLDDQTEGFSDFEQRLDWMFRMAGYADKTYYRGADLSSVTKFPWIIARQVIKLR